MFTLVVTYDWEIQQIDINNSFFNGDLQEKLFMVESKGFEDRHRTHFV